MKQYIFVSKMLLSSNNKLDFSEIEVECKKLFYIWSAHEEVYFSIYFAFSEYIWFLSILATTKDILYNNKKKNTTLE